MIEFWVNGKNYCRRESISVADFLEEIKIPLKSVIVEHNQEFLPSDKYVETFIHSGDKLEIVRAFAGG